MKALPNIHPGEVLLGELPGPPGISQNTLARAPAVPPLQPAGEGGGGARRAATPSVP